MTLMRQETAEAKRIKEEQLKAIYPQALQTNKIVRESTNTDSKSNRKFILVITAVLTIVFIYTTYSTTKAVREANLKAAKAKEQQIIKSRAAFNSAKTLITANKLNDDELADAAESFRSVDSSMPEFNEAQELLTAVNKKIYIAKEEKEAKKQKAAEDALYTPGGKRVYVKHPSWSVDDCNDIAKRKIRIGMDQEQVIAAWGRPESINTTTASYGTHEQWVYGLNRYVYFEDGTCTTIQN